MFQPLAVLLPLVFAAPSAPQGEPPQIQWQRSLDDALTLARAENRRLLIAINADGESASERIVRERYRDPEFVGWTDRFVCVVGSFFRHTPRDVDFAGNRVECPRLGQVTCGEHMALEPLLHERYLANTEIVLDGEVVERISPRHAVVDLEGNKAFDLFLLFDLRELDDAVRAAAEAEAPPEPTLRRPHLAVEGTREQLRIDLRETVRLKSALARHDVEQVVRDGLVAPNPLGDAILHAGDAGSSHALALLADAIGFERTTFIAQVSGAGAGLAFELQGELQSIGLGRPLLSPAGSAGDRRIQAQLAVLEQLDPEGTRTLRLSHAALSSAQLLETLRAVAADRPPPPPPAVDDRPSAEEFELQLELLEPQLAERPDDGALQRDFGRALLGLARRRIEVGDGSAGFLLEDAQGALERAAAAFPADFQLQLELARCAYYRSDFEGQEAAALRGLAIAGLDLDQRTEAFRWLGDAGARLIVERSLGDEGTEALGIERTANALMAAAVSVEADETDWVSFASFFGATGRPGEQSAVAQFALNAFPESDALRAAFAAGANWIGAPEEMVDIYADLVATQSVVAGGSPPALGVSTWYAGWALVNLAEWQRRGEAPDAAIESYILAEGAFQAAMRERPDYSESSQHYLGMCALGRGFAHLIADRRVEAADALVEAIAARPQIDGARDGLDREAIDLVDGVLEWRRTGASPVQGPDLAERLIEADPSSARWSAAVADALLREGLRAVGRADPAAGIDGLRDSVVVARRARALADDQDSRRAVAQSATSLAEVLLNAGLETAEPGPLLGEAAELLGFDRPAVGAGAEALKELAATLRAELGPARPIARTGR